MCMCIPTVLQPHGDMNERAVALAFFRHIKRDKSAKRIFAFLGLNFCFMLVHDTQSQTTRTISICVSSNEGAMAASNACRRFVEAAYGYWSNSLSLIADSGAGIA
jgi:Co/Zn/Cd efflux system component